MTFFLFQQAQLAQSALQPVYTRTIYYNSSLFHARMIIQIGGPGEGFGGAQKKNRVDNPRDCVATNNIDNKLQ